MSTTPAPVSLRALDSTYGAWLISLFIELILYGIGILQTFLYFQWWPNDDWEIKIPVLLVMLFETAQMCFFFRSSYFRFVQKFGEVQGDLIWSDSLQLLATYSTAFVVQLYFARRIWCCMWCSTYVRREGAKLYRVSRVGIYVVIFLAFVQMSAGLAQTIWTYLLRSFAKLDKTKAVTTLQTAASLACDVSITGYLYRYLGRHKHGTERTKRVLNALMVNAVNRGMLTSLSSAGTMVLFLVYPDTFWFFLPLAPNSKMYMNSMLATLNMRDHMRRKISDGFEGETVHLEDMSGINSTANGSRHQRVTAGSVSALEFRVPNPSQQSESTVQDAESMSGSKI